MNTARTLIAFVILVSPLASQAQSPELKVLQIEYDNQLHERVMDAYSESLAKLEAGYLGGVQRDLANAKANGDLESALSLEAEVKRIDKKGALPINDEQASKALKKLRAIYRLELAKLNAQRALGQAALLTPYLGKLKQLESDLTKADRLADAKAVMDYRRGVAAGVPMKPLATLVPPAAVPPPASPPQVPVPAKPAVTVAVVTPKVAPPVPPPASPPLPEPMPIAMTPGAAIEVASEIKSKSGGKDVVAGAIVFDAPPGDGRRGAKGILVITDPLTGTNGTTWSFRYTRQSSAQGMQIIHPHGRGQMIVHMMTSSVGISTPASWIEVGYANGDTKRVRKTKAFDEVFPLKDAEDYEVVSKLDGQGGYELDINGKIVATGRVTTTSPLSIEIKPGLRFPGAGRSNTLEFKGDNLPMHWQSGYSALILGAIDGGVNMCREVRFWPGLQK